MSMIRFEYQYAQLQRQNLRLVISPLSVSGPVKRNRNDLIDLPLPDQTGIPVRQLLRENLSEAPPVIIFEPVDRPRNRPFMHPEAAPLINCGSALCDGPPAVRTEFFCFIFQRFPAMQAIRPGGRPDLFPAGQADSLRRNPAAHRTYRRIQKI